MVLYCHCLHRLDGLADWVLICFDDPVGISVHQNQDSLQWLCRGLSHGTGWNMRCLPDHTPIQWHSSCQGKTQKIADLVVRSVRIKLLEKECLFLCVVEIGEPCETGPAWPGEQGSSVRPAR